MVDSLGDRYHPFVDEPPDWTDCQPVSPFRTLLSHPSLLSTGRRGRLFKLYSGLYRRGLTIIV